MPQSQLPDLNTMWLKWTDYTNNCLIQKDFAGAISSVYHLNAIFGAENRIEINTAKYEQLTKEHVKIKCTSCNEEIVYEDVKVIDKRLDLLLHMILEAKTERVWDCPKCNYENRISETERIQEKFVSPRYLGILPDPPMQKIGISHKRIFEHQAKFWVRLALDEISHALGIERREYVPKMERDDVLDDEDNN